MRQRKRRVMPQMTSEAFSQMRLNKFVGRIMRNLTPHGVIEEAISQAAIYGTGWLAVGLDGSYKVVNPQTMSIGDFR